MLALVDRRAKTCCAPAEMRQLGSEYMSFGRPETVAV